MSPDAFESVVRPQACQIILDVCLAYRGKFQASQTTHGAPCYELLEFDFIVRL